MIEEKGWSIEMEGCSCARGEERGALGYEIDGLSQGEKGKKRKRLCEVFVCSHCLLFGKRRSC